MNFRKFVGISMILSVLLAGAFLVAGSSRLGVETLSRQQAMAYALAPAGAAGQGGEVGAAVTSGVSEAVASAPLRSMPVGEYFPEADQYQRWLNGEIDVDFEGVSPALKATLLAEAMSLPAALRNMAPAGGPTVLTGFDSIDSNECCGGGTVVPPDPEMAAGPSHLIAVVNLALEVYDKSGNSLAGPVTYGTFFAPLGATCSTGGFDPNVLYDESTDRFYIGVDGDGDSYCLAVSQTSDATGAYWLYNFPVSPGSIFFDYPHAGVGNDAVYVGANLFGSGQGWVYALEKAPMLSGNIAAWVGQQLNTGHQTPQPMNLHGWQQGTWPLTGPHYIFAGTTFGNARSFELYSWDDPFGANNFQYITNFDLQAIHGVPVGSPIGSVQQGGATITGNDPRPLDFEYRNGYGYTAMTVSCNPGSGTVNCVQWAKVNLATQTIAETDVFATNGQYRYFPDMAADHCGNALVGYTKSSASSFPGTWAAGPVVAGSNPAETLLKAGDQTYSAFADRWGDYTGMTIDPDGVTFWYLGEYSKTNGNTSANWGDWISSVTLDCQTFDFNLSVTPPVVDVCIPDNAVYAVAVGSFGGYSDPVTLSASGVPSGYTAGFSANPVNPPGNSTMTLTGSNGAAAGSYDVDVVGVAVTSTHTTTVQLNLFDAAATVSLSSPPNGATGVGLAPTFTWTGTGTSYTIEIATDAGFTNIVETATVGGTTYTSSGLAANTTHFWRVTADNVCGGNTSAAWSFTTVDLLCSSPNVAIPDNNPTGVTNDLIVGNSGSIDDLNVSVEMTHSWVGDVVFTLQHVDTGTTVTFYDRPGVPASTFGCSGDNVDATLDDEAATPVEDECGAGVPAIAGSFIPNNPLSAFDGEDLAGTWRITASDLAGGDTGTLNTWCIDAGTSGGGTPDITVNPASLSSTQATNTVVVQQLTIGNVGTADLNWMIDEAAPVAPAGPVSGGSSERLGTTAPSSDAKIAGGVMPHGRTDVIADGGFEAGTPNPFWNEASSNFGSPICDIASCGQGGGTGPHAGTYWTWFGGIAGVAETGSMDQNVVIPAGTATLSFYLEIPVADSTGFMNVDIDGNVLFTVTEADTGTYAIYAPVSLDVSAYADGGSHNVRFSSTTDAGAGPLNFFVDDVVLDVQEGGGSACDAPSDIAWLSVSPTAGTTISGTSTLVDVTFDSTGYPAGTYTGTLCVNSNDPDTPLVEVPVEMVVTDVVINPAIVVTATVGLDPMTCATTSSLVVGQPSTDVYYCYTVENTGNITLSLHDIMDDVGTNLSGVAYDLAPGATADTVALGLTISETVTTDTTNTVVWTAYLVTGASATASSTASVTEAPTDVTLSSFGGDSATLLPLLVATLAALLVGLGLLLRRRSQLL